MLGEAGGGRAGTCRTREGARGCERRGGDRGQEWKRQGDYEWRHFCGRKEWGEGRDGGGDPQGGFGTSQESWTRKKRACTSLSLVPPIRKLSDNCLAVSRHLLHALVLSDYHAERCFARGCPPPSLPLLACALNSFHPLVGRHTDQLSNHSLRFLQCCRDCEYRNCYR